MKTYIEIREITDAPDTINAPAKTEDGDLVIETANLHEVSAKDEIVDGEKRNRIVIKTTFSDVIVARRARFYNVHEEDAPA